MFGLTKWSESGRKLPRPNQLIRWNFSEAVRERCDNLQLVPWPKLERHFKNVIPASLLSQAVWPSCNSGQFLAYDGSSALNGSKEEERLCNIWGIHDGDYEECCVRFEVFTAVTMKNGVFWDVTPSSQILVTLMKEALGSSETSVLTRATRRNIPKTQFFMKSQSHFATDGRSVSMSWCRAPDQMFVNSLKVTVLSY
jgi:hypothetical protein